MTSMDDIEQLVRNLRTTTRAAFDERVLNDAATAMEQSAQHETASGREGTVFAASSGHTRRFIMSILHRPALRWTAAVAACGAVAIIVAVSVFGPTTQSAHAELAQAVENSKAAKWAHWRCQLDDFMGMTGKWEVWICTQPFQMYNKLPNGTIQFADSQTNRVYDPIAKSIHLTDTPAGAITGIPARLDEALAARLAEAEKKKWPIEKKVDGGLLVYTITLTQDGEGYERCFVNRKTNLIVKTEEKVTDGTSGTWRLLVREFDYPDAGPTDIYSLGVPRDAAVVDRRRSAPPTPLEKRLAAMLSPDKVLASTEELGLLVSVHEIVNCGDGKAIALVSFRPSQQTLKKLGPGAFATINDQFVSYGIHLAGAKTLAYGIGELSSRGITAWWSLLESSDRSGPQAKEIAIQANISTSGRLREYLEAKGLPWRKGNVVIGTVAMPEARRPIADVLASIHKQACEFDQSKDFVRASVVGKHELLQEGLIGTTNLPPSETTPARMAEAMEQHRQMVNTSSW